MSSEAPSSSPRYMGGQAVVEGVMMRGERTWAVAVRTPEGDIEIEAHDTPTWAEKWAKIPWCAGSWRWPSRWRSASRRSRGRRTARSPRRSRSPRRRWAGRSASRSTFFTAIFIVLPAVAANGIGNILGLDGFWFHVAEGALRLAIFLGYLLLIGLLKDIKRVFQYHGAEHKAIAAYENDVELTAESAQQFDTSHVRCGTNFLLTVMVITIVVYSFVGRPGWALLILSRIVLIPLIAGLSYEVIRFAARHMDQRVGARGDEARPAPAAPDHASAALDQVEVAVASLRAVLTAEQLAEVEARPRRRSNPSVQPALGSA